MVTALVEVGAAVVVVGLAGLGQGCPAWAGLEGAALCHMAPAAGGAGAFIPCRVQAHGHFQVPDLDLFPDQDPLFRDQDPFRDPFLDQDPFLDHHLLRTRTPGRIPDRIPDRTRARTGRGDPGALYPGAVVTPWWTFLPGRFR